MSDVIQCKNPMLGPHVVDPRQVTKCGGYCFDCWDCGVPDLVDQIAALREVVERYERASISYHEAAVKPERWVAWCIRKGTAGFYEGTQHNSEHAARKHIRESANITPDLLRRAGMEENDGHSA